MLERESRFMTQQPKVRGAPSDYVCTPRDTLWDFLFSYYLDHNQMSSRHFGDTSKFLGKNLLKTGALEV
jgi:hypothetical protein